MEARSGNRGTDGDSGGQRHKGWQRNGSGETAASPTLTRSRVDTQICSGDLQRDRREIGAAVRGLQLGDFRVFDEGVEQPLTYFDASTNQPA